MNREKKFTVVYGQYQNEIDRLPGHVEVSGAMYQKHLPISIEYITITINGRTTIEEGGEE